MITNCQPKVAWILFQQYFQAILHIEFTAYSLHSGNDVHIHVLIACVCFLLNVGLVLH